MGKEWLVEGRDRALEFLLPKGINRFMIPLKFEVDALTGIYLVEAARHALQGEPIKATAYGLYVCYGILADRALVYLSNQENSCDPGDRFRFG